MPAPLTINALAEHYEVSFTPVRTALEQLAEQGLLTKMPNGRLARVAPRENGSTSKLAKVALPAPPRNSYTVIAGDLVDLSLEGESIYLREEATAEKYGLSRSAVRNIFHRLAGSGILDHIPRRGWKLRTFHQDDLDSFCEVREVLELKALDLARPHLIDADLQAMLDSNRLPSSEEELPVLDNLLHSYFIDKAENFYIKDFFGRHGGYFTMMFRREAKYRDAAVEAVHEHREILTALLNKDWRGARKALSCHIRNHRVLREIWTSR